MYSLVFFSMFTGLCKACTYSSPQRQNPHPLIVTPHPCFCPLHLRVTVDSQASLTVMLIQSLGLTCAIPLQVAHPLNSDLGHL